MGATAPPSRPQAQSRASDDLRHHPSTGPVPGLYRLYSHAPVRSSMRNGPGRAHACCRLDRRVPSGNCRQTRRKRSTRTMIITRSPLRISLGGGGTDLPSYYRQHGGFVIGGAIDKYVYITLHQTIVDELIIKYSKMERVKSVEEVQHPIIREALKLTHVGAPRLEITSMADIP